MPARSTVTVACDEGPAPKRFGAARTPLMYFSIALAFWLIT